MIEGDALPLQHPDLDIIIIVLTVAPCVYYGVMDGVRRGMQRKKPVRLPSHPMRREGDKYAYYFYLAYRYCGPDSLVARIPKLGTIPTSLLAAVALKLVITKGEQYHHVRQTKVS